MELINGMIGKNRSVRLSYYFTCRHRLRSNVDNLSHNYLKKIKEKEGVWPML